MLHKSTGHDGLLFRGCYLTHWQYTDTSKPVLVALTFSHQAPGRAATRAPISMSKLWSDWKAVPRPYTHKWQRPYHQTTPISISKLWPDRTAVHGPYTHKQERPYDQTTQISMSKLWPDRTAVHGPYTHIRQRPYHPTTPISMSKVGLDWTAVPGPYTHKPQRPWHQTTQAAVKEMTCNMALFTENKSDLLTSLKSTQAELVVMRGCMPGQLEPTIIFIYSSETHIFHHSIQLKHREKKRCKRIQFWFACFGICLSSFFFLFSFGFW